MAKVSVRYIVNDMDAAVSFYTTLLGFTVFMRPDPAFAMLDRGDLRLLLSVPNEKGGGGRTLDDGRRPEPGGWNRMSLEVSGLVGIAADLHARGARSRGGIIHGVGGDQILIDDPSGNCVELFEPHEKVPSESTMV